MPAREILARTTTVAGTGRACSASTETGMTATGGPASHYYVAPGQQYQRVLRATTAGLWMTASRLDRSGA